MSSSADKQENNDTFNIGADIVEVLINEHIQVLHDSNARIDALRKKIAGDGTSQGTENRDSLSHRK